MRIYARDVLSVGNMVMTYFYIVSMMYTTNLAEVVVTLF